MCVLLSTRPLTHAHRNAEIDAENVSLLGPQRFEVPAGSRLVLRPGGAEGAFTQQLLPLGAAPSWHWRHSMEEETGFVRLSRAGV